jgi:2-hydroxychromene-2-carboxylate isomerase
MPQDVDFFFDFVSPYTYLAQTQLAGLKERTGAGVQLWPMHLPGHRSLGVALRCRSTARRLRLADVPRR